MSKNSFPNKNRILSIDILRGIVIVVMTIDHARDFFHISSLDAEDLTQTYPALFFTRWVTHFCAPVFVFLSGVSAFLHAERGQLSKKQLAWFLVSRGLWLIFVEIVVINFAWQFKYSFIFIQVIWIIGISMIMLAGLIYLPRALIILLSAVTIAGHNLFDQISPEQFGDFAWIWKILHVKGWIPLPETSPISGIAVVFPLIPWVGVMGLGYAAGRLFLASWGSRDRFFGAAGFATIAAFLVLRFGNVYGDPQPWSVQAGDGIMTFISFLNTTKYPASLLFLLMTLGPALALIPVFERMTGRLGKFFITFGKVPFFYYILHFFLIHILAVIWFGIDAKAWNYDVYNRTTYPDVAPSLLRVYLATAATVGVLYLPCRWFGRFKQRHKNWGWLSYL